MLAFTIVSLLVRAGYTYYQILVKLQAEKDAIQAKLAYERDQSNIKVLLAQIKEIDDQIIYAKSMMEKNKTQKQSEITGSIAALLAAGLVGFAIFH